MNWTEVPKIQYQDQTNPRDVLCRVHFYRTNEEILRAAWKEGSAGVLEGSDIQIFPDLCWQTKIRRRMLNPLLDYIRIKGATYRWGFPMALVVKREGRSYYLSDPLQLPKCFEFLGSEPIKVPNWLELPVAMKKKQ